MLFAHGISPPLTAWAVRCLACMAILLVALSANAVAATELKILATDPAPGALLARQQPFYVRFELQSAPPTAVTVSGLYKGSAVIDDGGTGTPALLPAGGGIGVVSFFYWGEHPTRIDEVRLTISDSPGGATIKEYGFPVALTWLTDDPPPRVAPAWVTESKHAQAGGTAAPATAPVRWIAVASLLALLVIALVWLRRRRKSSTQRTAAEITGKV